MPWPALARVRCRLRRRCSAAAPAWAGTAIPPPPTHSGVGPGGPELHAALLGDLMRQLDEMVQHLPGANGQDPLTRIRQHIPRMRPHVAAKTSEALAHLNRVARERLFLPPDRFPLQGNPACPACSPRWVLYLQTAGPEAEWTVMCGAGCLCIGEACPCGMPVTLEGVAHVWDRSAGFVAAALHHAN